jgi:hypothetical protein
MSAERAVCATQRRPKSNLSKNLPLCVNAVQLSKRRYLHHLLVHRLYSQTPSGTVMLSNTARGLVFLDKLMSHVLMCFVIKVLR